MRRRTKHGVLLLALAVLAGAWLVAAYRAQLDREAAAEPVNAEAEGYDLSIGTQKDMTALSWAWNGNTVNLTRNAQGKWIDADDPGCPVDNARAGALARAAASVSASMAIEGVTELSQYGLDKPKLVVMAAAGDSIVSYEIGNVSITGEYYMRADGSGTVYMENSGLATAFQTDLTALLETESIPGNIEQVTGLFVDTDAQSYALTLSPDGTWRRDGGEDALEEGPVRSLYELVLSTDFSDCAGWNMEDDCGFDAPQGRVELTYNDESGRQGSFALEYGAYDGRQVFVRFEDSGLVYRTNAAALDALMYPDWDAMLPAAVVRVETEKIDSIMIGLDGAEYEVLRLREDEESDVVYSMNGWVLDTKALESWLLSLNALTSEGSAASREGRRMLFSLLMTEKQETDEDSEETESENEVLLTVWEYDSVHALCVTEDKSLLIPKDRAAELTNELESILISE